MGVILRVKYLATVLAQSVPIFRAKFLTTIGAKKDC